MLSIFSVNDWVISNSYKTHSVVKLGTNYYYALVDIPANTAFNTLLWGGYETVGSETKPSFLWRPSYNSPANHAPRVKRIQFGDGYEQRVRDGISNSLMEFEMAFDLRTTQEAFAILHFLETRNAVESFFFIPPSPYAERRKFICPEWTHTEVFFDNHTIRGKFSERTA